jgi:phosphoglycerate dehydrogenase-like enzyme
MGLEEAISEFREAFPQVTFVHCADRGALPQEIADAEVYVGWLDRDLFLAAKELQWVQSPSSGINYYLAIPEFVESDVLLTSARGTHGACLAESVIGMILAFTRGIRDCVLYQEEHTWAIRQVRPKLVELTGSTMGIIGFGTVGRAVAKRAQAFDMHIVAVDLYPDDKPDYVDWLEGLDHLSDLLQSSDYVVVTVPWTPETEDMIGPQQLDAMKTGAIIVGISRGGIIDQDALAQSLRQGQLSAAALDVFKPEPLPPESELWDLDNLLITPHAAGGTQFEGLYILEILKENLGRFFAGDLPLRNQIDKQRGF